MKKKKRKLERRRLEIEKRDNRLMVGAFFDVLEVIADRSILKYPDPEEEALNRYNRIINIMDDYVMRLGKEI